jgi:hypothetical protein
MLQESPLDPSRLLMVCDSKKKPSRGRREPRSPSAFRGDIERLLARDATYREASRRVLRRQDELRRRVDRHGWDAYLALEEAHTERSAYSLERVSAWAFIRGRRAR